MSRELASSLLAVGLGAAILALPFVFTQPMEAGVHTMAFGPFFFFGAPILLAGVLSALRQIMRRERVIGIVLLATSVLVLAISLNLFLPRMTLNDYIPMGVVLSAVLAAVGILSLTVKTGEPPAR